MSGSDTDLSPFFLVSEDAKFHDIFNKFSKLKQTVELEILDFPKGGHPDDCS